MNIFQSFPVRKPKGNMFNLSHEKKMSFNYGELIPMYLQEVIPGDRFRVSSEVMLRFAPLLAPIMHRINVYVHFFFVPNRLVWTSWEDFITGGPDGTLAPTFPREYITNARKPNFVTGTLFDYMTGVQLESGTTVGHNVYFNILPFRAYQLIYNEYYLDQNLETPIAFSTGSSGTYVQDCALRNRCWEKDYFTSCLPWSQRGGDVNLPVEGEIDFQPTLKNPALVPSAASGALSVNGSGQLIDSGVNPVSMDAIEDEIFDLENVAITINDLRQSIRLQQWLEKNARGGGRYIEQILSHFGVVSSDSRLQRPEYLGGGKAPVVISEVLSTAEGTTAEVGDMYGHGISVGNTNEFNRFFEEHGYVMGIISVMPRTAYQQGFEKHWLYNDKFDYYFPEFANLGEQEVQNQELYYPFTDGTDVNAISTFGYQSRYAHLKYSRSSVHGEFKNTLTYWHMGRIFSSAPALNSSFVHLDHTTAGVHRVHVVTSTSYDKIYAQIYNKVKAWRPMPKYGVPIL